MKTILISDFKARCIAVLKDVERSREAVVVTLRGRPLGRVEPFAAETPVKQLGALKGSMRFRRDLTHADTTSDWEMLKVKVLLDTHVWIWSQEDPDRLGPHTRRLLVAPDHQNYVCTMSTLELARLAATGDIDVTIALTAWVEQALRALQAVSVEMSDRIAMDAYALPGAFHKDPADRVLVAAARCHELTMLTADERILGYSGVRSRDARK